MENNEKHVTENDPKINYRGWKAMPYIIGNETFEKLGAIGTLANLLVYLTTVFNLKNITAANIINIFNDSTNFATFIGAFLSDTYFGRYKTIGFCTFTSFLGLLVIQLTAVFKNLHPPHCGKEMKTCKGPTAGQMAFLVSGFGLLLIGAAGVRPCNLAFGADQFNPNTDSGKKGINSFFNCWSSPKRVFWSCLVFNLTFGVICLLIKQWFVHFCPTHVHSTAVAGPSTLAQPPLSPYASKIRLVLLKLGSLLVIFLARISALFEILFLLRAFVE